MEHIGLFLLALWFTGVLSLPYPTKSQSKSFVHMGRLAHDSKIPFQGARVEVDEQRLHKRQSSTPAWQFLKGSAQYLNRLAEWAIESMENRVQGKKSEELSDGDIDFCIWINYVAILAQNQVFEAPDEATHQKWWDQARDTCRRRDPNSTFSQFTRLYSGSPPRGDPGNNIVIGQQMKGAGLIRAPEFQKRVFQQRQLTQQQPSKEPTVFGQTEASTRHKLQGWKPPSTEQTAVAGAGILTTGATIAAQKAGLFRGLIWGN